MLDEAKGKIEELRGKAKVALGNATGNKRWQTEGRVAQARGVAGRVVERIKGAVRRLIKR